MPHPFSRASALVSSQENRLRTLQLSCLTISCALILLYLYLNTSLGWIAIFYARDYIVLFGAAFFALSLTRPSFWSDRRGWFLCLVPVIWFLISESFLFLDGQMREDPSLFFSMYLLAYPFAAGAEDGDRRKGLVLAGGFYLCYTLFQTIRVLLCLLDFLPGFPLTGVTWDGSRLYLLYHPNISGCVLMLGVGIALIFGFRSHGLRGKILWWLAAVVQLIPLALTNSRTIVLLTGGLLGATLFFSQLGRSPKRLLLSLVIGLAFVPLFFTLSKSLYDWHTARLISYYQAQAVTEAREAADSAETSSQDSEAPLENPLLSDKNQEGSSEEDPEEGTSQPDSPIVVDPNTGEVSLQTMTTSGQGSLKENFSSFNGRTRIWEAVIRTVFQTPSIALFGCDSVMSHLEAHTGILAHAHNSWLQILMHRGVIGLLIALVFTLQALRNALVLLFRRESDGVQRSVALLLLCIMGAAFFEPYLFNAGLDYFSIEFIFFLSAGYLQVWYRQTRISR